MRLYADDPEFFGVLMPAESSGDDLKAIGCDTARLVAALEYPGPLPADLGLTRERTAARLVLDGILEIDAGGAFVSGTEAYRHLFPDPPAYQPAGRTGELTINALTSAERLITAPLPILARYLYRYNTASLSPRWRRTFPAEDVALEQLRALEVSDRDAGVSTWRLIERPGDYWLTYQRADAAIDVAEFGRRTIYKLYVSPAVDAVAEALRRALPILTDSAAIAFKVGRDLRGLLRPDKMVVYFARHAELVDAASRLGPALAGHAAQGVPFSASVTPDGMLSWGIDPPEEVQTFGWQGGESWRVWVTNRLASALREAGRRPTEAVAPWRFALAAIELEGIDPRTFVGQPGLWTGSGFLEQQALS